MSSISDLVNFCLVGCAVVVGLYFIRNLFVNYILPGILHKTTKIIDKNPKWLVSSLESLYGFHDIDFMIVRGPLTFLFPHFYLAKNNRFEMWVPEYTTTNQADDIAKLAIAGKLTIKYGIGLTYIDKPIYWFSVLCYLLDGGPVIQDAFKFEKRQ